MLLPCAAPAIKARTGPPARICGSKQAQRLEPGAQAGRIAEQVAEHPGRLGAANIVGAVVDEDRLVRREPEAHERAFVDGAVGLGKLFLAGDDDVGEAVEYHRLARTEGRPEFMAEIGDRVSLGGLELYFVSPDASILEELVGDAEEEGKTRSTVQFTAKSVKTVGDVRLSSLSPAELEIVRWICRGLTTFEEIGRKLFRSPHTVRTQLGSVFKKLDVHSREQLLALMRKCEIAWTQPESNGADDTIGPIKRDH